MTHRRGHSCADPGHLHRSRDARAGAVLHQHRSAGLRADQSAGNGQGRAVRALLAIGQVAAAAVPGRVSRRGRFRRRTAARARRGVGTARADKLYARVLNEYGDDSVAQLGGAHIACEGVSNVLTKVLEWGRLMAYLEQSTRYVPYTDRPERPLEVPRARRGRALAARGGVQARRWTSRSTTYARWIPAMEAHFRARYPKVARGLRRGLPVGDPRQGARHAARSAAGGDDVQRRAVRHGPGVRGAAPPHVRASARRGARARRADAGRAPPGDPGVSGARRSARSRRPLDRVLRRHAAAIRDGGARHSSIRPGRADVAEVSADRVRSGRRDQGRRGRALPGVASCPTISCSSVARR